MIKYSLAVMALCLGLATPLVAQSRTSPPQLPASRTQSVLNDAALAGKFTYIVFTKGDSAASRSMMQIVKAGVAAREANSTFSTADANAASEQALVQKYGIGRAPMPVTVVVAPNGAVTGVFAKVVKEEQLAASIVPPTMMRCMKSLQDKKLVFVCLTHEAADQAEVPAGVSNLSLDPQFKDRVEVVSMQVDDPTEARFIEQMQVNPQQVSGPYAVLIAPPGVLVGHYGVKATREEIAAAIHKAGQCCEDPNCKHNGAKPATASNPKSTTKRN